jgi:alpha-L-arabinofuranosidase
MKYAIFSFYLLVFNFIPVTAQVNIYINAGARGSEIGKNHYGIFFEEINHAGDGGLYAELVRNRSFEDNAAQPESWTATGEASLSLTTTNLLNSAQGQALHVTAHAAGGGVYNSGFWGMNFEEGKEYNLSLWAKGNVNALTVALQDENGNNCGTVVINGGNTASWEKYTAAITATASTSNGRLAIIASAPGSFYLDMVSLFPPTFKNRTNGCRIDLAEKLEALKPGFMRFPGGCYVEGEYADGNANRFEWKKTVGAIEERPGHLNKNWGYRVSDGLGYHEFLQLCEDLGAEPLFVANIGLGHGWVVNYRQIDDFVQEALDAIEYANADVSTPYGALRAANGHPEPFGMKMIEIGNENYNYSSENNNDQSDHYAERYAQFQKAISAQYPYMKLIGNVQSWSTDNPTWRNAYPVPIVDEHYYRNPAWFENQYNKYDSYSRSNYKIYVGEYAVTSNYGTTGNLNAALGEAVYMAGMENNSDVCIMNSYAPVFINENDRKWNPDLIRFNAGTSFGTPSYYIQQLFSNNVGKQNVKWTEENNILPSAFGKIGLGTWKTAASFDNLLLTDMEGNSLITDDFADNAAAWTTGTGTWRVSSGAFTQTDTALEGCTAINQTSVSSSHYSYQLTATKTGGAEGFLIIFNYLDDQNYCWWNIGGWNNSQHAIEQCINGTKSTLVSTSGTLTTGKEYALKIEINGSQVKCYLDGVLVHDTTLPARRQVYTAASINDETGMMYVKLINPSSQANTVTLHLSNADVENVSAIVLAAGDGTDENTLANPNKVVPEAAPVSFSNNPIEYTVLPYSANIVRLKLSKITIEMEEAEPLPVPVVKYSFEQNRPADDSGAYPATLHGAAGLIEMSDGNHVLYTGSIGGSGYLNLGNTTGRSILNGLNDSYTLSIDLMSDEENTLSNYGWAYAFCNGTSKYIGLVNTAGNGNWYYEIRNTAAENAQSHSGLYPGVWHNLTFVQQDKLGKIYLDGHLLASATINTFPADIASSLTAAYLGRSPYTADSYMENTCIDNFQVFAQSLTSKQIETLCQTTQTMSHTKRDNTKLVAQPPADTNAPVNVYSINGSLLRRQIFRDNALKGLVRGIYIVNNTKQIKE